MRTLAIARIYLFKPTYHAVFRVYEKVGEFKNGNWRKKKLNDFDTEADAINYAQSISHRILLATEEPHWL